MNPWVFACAVPLALWMTLVLIFDLTHLGKKGDSDTPLLAGLIVGSIMTAFLVGAWRLSGFRYRSVALAAGLAFMWVVPFMPPGINLWDIVVDVGLLASTVVMLVPPGRKGA